MESFAQDAAAVARRRRGDGRRRGHHAPTSCARPIRRLLEDRERQGAPRTGERRRRCGVINLGAGGVVRRRSRPSCRCRSTRRSTPPTRRRSPARRGRCGGTCRSSGCAWSRSGTACRASAWTARASCRPAILRGDPRLLIARQIRDRGRPVPRPAHRLLRLDADVEPTWRRRKLFGTLLAEAAKGLRGIDVRRVRLHRQRHLRRRRRRPLRRPLLERRAAATTTPPRCGTRRWPPGPAGGKAKLLVMISDGSPTECTTTALKALVSRLTPPHEHAAAPRWRCARWT